MTLLAAVIGLGVGFLLAGSPTTASSSGASSASSAPSRLPRDQRRRRRRQPPRGRRRRGARLPHLARRAGRRRDRASWCSLAGRRWSLIAPALARHRPPPPRAAQTRRPARSALAAGARRSAASAAILISAEEARPHLRRLAAHRHARARGRARAGRRPSAALLERGVLIPDCVSSFPSVTPVACAEMVTGVAADRHWISGMNWYHRLERRYVEYGSSLEATRAFGVFRALYDLVYNMNLAHLSPGGRDPVRALDDAGAAHRLHAVPDLPRPPPPRGLPRRPAAAGGRRDPAEVPPSHLGPARALLRRPLREPRGPLQVDLDPRQPRRVLGLLRGGARRADGLRLPPLLAAGQRQLLPPPRARRRASSRSPRPTTASRNWSRRRAASTASSPTTR